MTEKQKGRQRIYMGTFRIAVSIGLFENFHNAWATIFKLFRRVMPRAPSIPDAPSLSQSSAGLMKLRRKVLPTPNSLPFLDTESDVLACIFSMETVKVQDIEGAYSSD